MRKTIWFIASICLLSIGVQAKPAVLEEVMIPDGIAVDDSFVYVTEDTTVRVFSLKDFKLKTTFGKAGEGPGEFMPKPSTGGSAIGIVPLPEQLFIRSLGKISCFSKTGALIKEMKTGKSRSTSILPFGDNYLSFSEADTDGKGLVTRIRLMDPQLNPIKVIYTSARPLGEQPKLRIFSKSFIVRTFEDKIYVADKQEFHIAIFDKNGKPLPGVSMDYPLPVVSDEDKNSVIQWFKTSPRTRDTWAFLKTMVEVSDNYAAIKNFWVTGGAIYVMTYKTTDGKREFFIFGPGGKLKEKKLLKIFENNIMEDFPTTVYKGKLYQLVEDPDDETWNLHVTAI